MLPSRVLFAYRSDVDVNGGAAGMMRRTAEALRCRGVTVDVTLDADPPLVSDYDVVHAFNVWKPETALVQMQRLHAAGVPLVWQPIYLRLSEFAVVSLAAQAIFGVDRDELERGQLVRALVDGSLQVNGMSRHAPMEPEPAFFSRVSAMAALADHVCVFSHTEIQSLFQTTGLVNKPFSVIPHGVDVAMFASATPNPFQEQFGVFDFVLCVGAVEARKNQLFLIEALRGTETKIVLIGPSFDAAYLAMCRARGGDDVIYVDRVSQDMVASAYKAARVHVLPSYAEGAAMANLEAAAAGCPIVVSNRSSEFEYFGDLACYCDPVDPDSIRAAVAQAWRGREAEPERWSDLAAAMRAHSWQNAADATLAAYRRVLARSRR